MKNKTLRITLSSLGLFAFLGAAMPLNAAPVRFKQVVQVINAKPGKANIGSFTQLRLADDPATNAAKSEEDKIKPSGTPPQDGRVIVTTTSEMVEAEDCACDATVYKPGGGFPKWALLGLGAVPVGLLLANLGDDDDDPTPTPPITPPPTTVPPTIPPTEPPTEPVPEPMTILLFGTGLASVGIAARKRLRRKGNAEESESEENK